MKKYYITDSKYNYLTYNNRFWYWTSDKYSAIKFNKLNAMFRVWVIKIYVKDNLKIIEVK